MAAACLAVAVPRSVRTVAIAAGLASHIFFERVGHPEVIVVHVFVVSLYQILKIGTCCSGGESGGVGGQKFTLDMSPVTFVDVGVVVKGLPPQDSSITKS